MLRRTKEYYIIKAGTVHGDRYDYSQVHYTKAKDKVDFFHFKIDFLKDNKRNI